MQDGDGLLGDGLDRHRMVEPESSNQLQLTAPCKSPFGDSGPLEDPTLKWDQEALRHFVDPS